MHEPEDLAAALDAMATIAPRYAVPILIDAYSSLRWSELAAVKSDDLDLKARTVRVDERVTELGGSGGRWDWDEPKTAASADTVALPGIVMKPLLEHLLAYPPLVGAEDTRCEGLVFHERGEPLRRKAVRRQWRAACEAAGVPAIRIGWLRHTGASMAYHATKDPKATAERLRHRDMRMVDRTYIRLYEGTARQTADAIDELAARRLGWTRS